MKTNIRMKEILAAHAVIRSRQYDADFARKYKPGDLPAAIDLIRQYQGLETHPFLRSEFSIIAGEEEFIPYRAAKKERKARR